MKKFSAKEVYEVCEKEIINLRKAGTPEVQMTLIELAYLNLYSQLTLDSIKEEIDENIRI